MAALPGLLERVALLRLLSDLDFDEVCKSEELALSKEDQQVRAAILIVSLHEA